MTQSITMVPREAMSFYGDDKADDTAGSGIARTPRKKMLRGINGLFFTLFVMRTVVSLVVASARSACMRQPGGRAFTWWICFLHGGLSPFVRLPSVHERSLRPCLLTTSIANGMSTAVVLVLDATESETEPRVRVVVHLQAPAYREGHDCCHAVCGHMPTCMAVG